MDPLLVFLLLFAVGFCLLLVFGLCYVARRADDAMDEYMARVTREELENESETEQLLPPDELPAPRRSGLRIVSR